VVESGTLLRCYTGNRIEGSNPSLSARVLLDTVFGIHALTFDVVRNVLVSHYSLKPPILGRRWQMPLGRVAFQDGL
jgi:hypothetical protein